MRLHARKPSAMSPYAMSPSAMSKPLRLGPMSTTARCGMTFAVATTTETAELWMKGPQIAENSSEM